ncbi:MAG: oxidoreductase, partial [Myxococcales bacterium]|nr:oxidoreductase [Myxococcales bacterium]
AGARPSTAPPQPAAAPRVEIAVGASPTRGSADAKVTVVEFSDFECPACSRAEPTVAALRAQLGDKVRLVWKNLPLTMHSHAHLAAEAALAAGAQGKFWEMHDALFADQQHLERGDLERRAEALKLDLKRFRRALDEHTYAAAVDADAELATRVGVSGTPTFFIDGSKLANWTELPTAAAQALGRVQAAVRPRPGQPDPGAVYQALVGDAPAHGARAPKVTIVEWADFECPFCGRLTASLEALLGAHADDLRIVYKQFPLPNHPHAQLAAEASLAAHAQGRFWQLQRALFAHQTALDRPSLDKYAAEAGLDMARFRSDLDGHKYARAVAGEVAEGQRIGVTGTPSFFIDGRFHEGADTTEQLEKKLEAAFADADARIARGTPRARLYDVLMKSAKREVEAPPIVEAETRAVDPGPTAPSVGRKQAPVTVVEFSDFQCPYCKRAADLVSNVRQTYGDDVRVVFRQFPLPYHKSAHLAAEASLAAHEQGKFWEMHDKLFANQAAIDRASIAGYARELGLDAAKFAAALDGGKYAAAVNADVLAGGALVDGTPTLFVNGHKLTNPALLAQAVGQELKKRRR